MLKFLQKDLHCWFWNAAVLHVKCLAAKIHVHRSWDKVTETFIENFLGQVSSLSERARILLYAYFNLTGYKIMRAKIREKKKHLLVND